MPDSANARVIPAGLGCGQGRLRGRPLDWILEPGPHHVEAPVNQRVPVRTGVAHEDADLAVVDFAHAAAPLPLHADRFRSLLGERRRIENDHTIRDGIQNGLIASRFDPFPG